MKTWTGESEQSEVDQRLLYNKHLNLSFSFVVFFFKLFMNGLLNCIVALIHLK